MMEIGEKIKRLRSAKLMTQAELAGGEITRNMLSAIESGKASPSVETAKYLAQRLSVPLAYLMSEDDDLFIYKRKNSISNIRSLYKAKDYTLCIEKVKGLGEEDDELSYILAECYYHIGKENILNGSLAMGGIYISEALKYSEKTVYNTLHIKAGAMIYQAISSNIQAPLPELNVSEYESVYENLADVELYKYIIQDTEYNFKSKFFASHTEARGLIKNRRFRDALKILCCCFCT